MKIQKILVSQSAPSSFEKSPLNEIATKDHFEITFKPFTIVEKVSLKEFRTSRVDFLECNALIFNSRHAIDHYFSLASEARVTIPDEMKYFCTSETIALYLQKYIVYRKRKIFFGNGTFADLLKTIVKHKELTFMMPYTDKPKMEYGIMLKNAGITVKNVWISKNVPQDLSDCNFSDYDLITLYSSKDVIALNDYIGDKKTDLKIATSGKLCTKTAFEAGFNIVLWSTNQIFPSMVAAIDQYCNDIAKNKSVENYALKSLDEIPTSTKK